MRHIVHLMLGEEQKRILCDIKQYVIKYGSEEAKTYFNALLYSGTNYGATISTAEAIAADDSTFVSGIDNLFTVSLQPFCEIPDKNRTEYLRSCFTSLYNTHININNQGDSNSLHLCLYVPLYEKRYWAIAKEILSVIESIEQKYHVDLFLLPYDLAFLIESDTDKLPVKMAQYQEQTKATVDDILAAKKEFGSLGHMVMIQNCNSEGLSLDLNEDSFVRIVGEYALLSINHYADIFPENAQSDERPIHALGLSVLSFDKYYFVQYLLHQAYIYILDREQVLQDEVDVNKVSQIVQTILQKNVNVFSDFYNKQVRPRIEKHISQDTILVEVRPEWEKELQRLTDEFQSYIDRPDLTLPEKKATLAQLLGEDDELLVGYMFNRKQLVIDDCSREVLDYYAKANNSLFSMHENIEEDDSETVRQHKEEANEIADHAALSATSNAPQEMPSEIIDKLKNVKMAMRESSNYIRLKSQELNEIQNQTEEHKKATKRLTEKGFVFDGNTYQLQKDIHERPCEEDYIPGENRLTKVDLRTYFTPIKDQRKLGACSSFAMVAIFEYILKKNRALDKDLSEAFVYYHALSREQSTANEGTSLYNNIVALTTEGVCLETFCPYNDQEIKPPSVEATADALHRRSRKALNVKKDIKHIKSAIAQGFPVAVSLRVFDSFQPVAGFIPRPTEEEIKSDNCGNHAMVLCGYSDDEKVFIARNSWGTHFGDNGYCYLPYSYIEDFLNVACIVTEINMENIHVEGNDTKTTISFDLSNNSIKKAILRNLIDEEKHRLGILNSELQHYEFAYNKVFQALGNNTTRTTICDGTLKQLDYQIQELATKKSRLEPTRTEALEEFDRKTIKTIVGYCLSWLIPVILFAILLGGLHLDPAKVFLNVWTCIFFYGGWTLLTVLFILWKWQRRRLRIDLDADYKNQIEVIERQIIKLTERAEITRLKSHIAGMIIDSLYRLQNNLHSKYNGMHSYIGNLSVWRNEEDTSIRMSDCVREPFLSLISNRCLEEYFLTCKDEITKPIKLYELFRESYQVEEKEIIRFKNKLKNTLVDELFAKLNNFSVYKQISGNENYPYAVSDMNDINTLLQQMDHKSTYFLRTISTIDSAAAQNTHCKLLFVDADVETTRQEWKQIYSKNFTIQPTRFQSDSHFRLSLLQMVGLAYNEISILKR